MSNNPNVPNQTPPTPAPLPPQVPPQTAQPTSQAVPQAPAPQVPAPQAPAPQAPAPQVPAPQVPAPQAPAPQVPALPLFALSQSDSYFLQKHFDQNVAAFAACQNLTTGYKILDRQQPFYPGFYCLGAISSLGKTTFAQQMADQIAASGRYVLYVTLEQTDFELFSKSLARGFWRTNRLDTKINKCVSTYPTPSSIDIRRNQTGYPAEVARQINDYISAVGARVIVAYGAFSMTVEDIIQLIDLAMAQLGAKPVVIVDYLQLMAPTQINGRIPDTKTSIDHIVHTLKAKQSTDGLTVLAISSMNRQNYLSPVDFESFKESGGIEYTADVIWGLQLSILSDDDFYFKVDKDNKRRETSLKEKREMVKHAKAACPRCIDLVCLKNRYGISSYEVPFWYYPSVDYFGPVYNPSDPDTIDDYKL